MRNICKVRIMSNLPSPTVFRNPDHRFAPLATLKLAIDLLLRFITRSESKSPSLKHVSAEI